MIKNFALREEPIDQISPPIVSNPKKSILDWIEQQGRFMTDESQLSEKQDTEELDSDILGDLNDDLRDDDFDFEMDESSSPS